MHQRVRQIGSSLLLRPSFAFPVQQQIPHLDTLATSHFQLSRFRRFQSALTCATYLDPMVHGPISLVLGSKRSVLKDASCWVHHFLEATLISNGHEANVWQKPTTNVAIFSQHPTQDPSRLESFDFDITITICVMYCYVECVIEGKSGALHDFCQQKPSFRQQVLDSSLS